MKKCYENVCLIDGKNFFGEKKYVTAENDIVIDISDTAPNDVMMIDGGGRFLSPSWIDVHGHSDMAVFGLTENCTRNAGGFGIEIAGNCGLSPFPVSEKNRSNLNALYSGYQTDITWDDYKGYAQKLTQSVLPFQLFSFCGHNTLHSAVLGYEDAYADVPAVKKMSFMLAENLEAGALGLSLGLLYSPGRFAKAGELDALFKCCAEKGKLVCAHLRSEGDFLLESIVEMFELCRRNDLNDFHISHLKTAGERNFHKIDDLFKLLDRAEKDYGVNVTFDRYPFTQSMTQLSVIGPDKYLSVPDKMITEKLANHAERDDFLKYLKDLPPEKWQKTTLAKCRIDKFRKFCGMTFAEIGENLKISPAKIVIAMLAEDSVGTCAAFDALSEKNMLRIISDRRCFCGSDETAAVLDGTWRMPRNQFSGFKTIELQMQNGIPLPEIIAKLTWRAAERFNIPVKQELSVGARADFTLF